MPFLHDVNLSSSIRERIANTYRSSEKEVIASLLKEASLDKESLSRIERQANTFVEYVRKHRRSSSGIDSFLKQYSLSSEEGIALMCLAEALLRVPDKATIDDLIKDKISGANWKSYLGQSSSLFVNTATWGLMLTGKLLKPERAMKISWSNTLKNILSKSSEGVIRASVAQAMRIMSKQFVMGRNVKEALKRAERLEKEGYSYSYDMLGEAAMTEKDALRYYNAYLNAIDTIGKSSQLKGIKAGPGISIKLSALYSRYEVANRKQAIEILSIKLLTLAQRAKSYDIGLTVDAEEADRLDLSLDIIEKVFSDPSLNGWEGFGLAVQSYQKRAFFVLDWVAEQAKKNNRRMMVRLIKGAYWDSEIKHAQMEGLSEYPVFTYKVFTDVSFHACAKKLFTLTDFIYPQFATHNAYSVALILELSGDYNDFEFQCLHGMGQELYSMITPKNKMNIPCRIYAPVGSHEDLLPYLVRRLLENGANSSFVNRIVDDKAPISDLVASPNLKAEKFLASETQPIPLPQNIFSNRRLNSNGFDISDYLELIALSKRLSVFDSKKWSAVPLIENIKTQRHFHDVYSPSDTQRLIGQVAFTEVDDIETALSNACQAQQSWKKETSALRAQCLIKMADLLELNREEAYALLMLEAGKTLNDCIAEVREAIDFCRYYAVQATELQSAPVRLPGYTGEINLLSYHPRGVLLCISPWNFPLAIFLGQIVASLVTGNAVIAKPAEQTSLIGAFAVELLYQAGIPNSVIQFLPGLGKTLGPLLIKDARIKGVLFTGSTETAQQINRNLAAREGEIVPFIAETGGQNTMLVDSSALLEQVTRDVMLSSFGSAGQRCSALRVLYVQQDIFEPLKNMLIGAMEMLNVDLPFYHRTDLGPVIDKDALARLEKHIELLKDKKQLIYQTPIKAPLNKGYFISPTLAEIGSISELKTENFGPILHLIPYKKTALNAVIEEINNSGFGLTLGIHSRIEDNIEYIASRVNVGNCYINRNVTGAVVGVQPFGGEGLSGTGPKAGGPNYLLKLCHERTLTIDTTAAGGNATLMAEASE